MTRKSRTNDDLITIIANFCDGNPGAMQCLTDLARVGQRHPLAFAYGVIMFEALGLSGVEIYMLWNDCLDRSTGALVTLIDLWRNDSIRGETILEHVHGDGGRGLPLNIKRTVFFE